jgi:uncharacterized protein YndB with AHSA1/START domain
MPVSNASPSRKLEVRTQGDREIVMTRVFDAPRRLVFEAMTSPEHVKQWFGPHGWTCETSEIDFRVAGKWRSVLRSPDGRTMGMSGVYKEIAPPERFVSTESFDDFPGESLNTLTFVEQDGKTTFTVTVLSPSAEVRDIVLRSGMERGAGETYDRLADHLKTMVQSAA